jgi:hypothetical protein
MRVPSKATIGSMIMMLTVAPLCAATTLVCWHPDRWGGGGTEAFLAIPVIAAYGLITVPLWPTYIPALILKPLVMRRAARWPGFGSMPLPLLVVFSTLIGGAAGIGVFARVILMAMNDAGSLSVDWIAAGAVSGAITLTCICLVQRHDFGKS